MVASFYIGDDDTMYINSLIVCFVLFIFTEILVFLSFFWSNQNTFLDSSMFTGLIPLNINADIIVPVHMDIPALMSVILFGSSIIAFLFYFPQYSYRYCLLGIILLICIGIYFSQFEYMEYTSHVASINSNIYLTYKFIITGLHWFHVLIGINLLCVIVSFILLGLVNLEKSVLIFNGLFYSQFVDIIWVIVYVTQFIYPQVFLLYFLGVDIFH